MKTRWIGISGVALIVAALLLGILGPSLLPTGFRTMADSGSSASGIMGSNTLSGGMVGNSGMMGGSNTMMNGGSMMGSSGGIMGGSGE